MRLRPTSAIAALGFALALVLSISQVAANSLPVRVDRWLEVRQVSGLVSYQRGSTSQPARVGTRLQAVGDSLLTGDRSDARLAVDTGVGFVQVSEKTILRVQRLESVADGGRITYLEVPQGQVRLQVRSFTNPSSELEIRTPANVSGVRGTDFGVSVQPDGKTGVATLEGGVQVAAEGEAVAVTGGFQNLTVPGEPPQPPVPLTEDTRLDLQQLTATNRTVRILGQVEPVNLLLVEDELQTLERDGSFEIQVPLPVDRRIAAVVITPLGKRQAYELVVP